LFCHHPTGEREMSLVVFDGCRPSGKNEEIFIVSFEDRDKDG
jgi:hypothetical protein